MEISKTIYETRTHGQLFLGNMVPSWKDLTSVWYHFYFHQLYTDFTANYKIK